MQSMSAGQSARIGKVGREVQFKRKQRRIRRREGLVQKSGIVFARKVFIYRRPEVTILIARRCAVLFSLLLSVVASGYSQAQVYPRGNGLALDGITQFDVYAEVTDWVGLDVDPKEFRLSMQKVFEAGLESAGAFRRVAARDSLICRVQATVAGDLVAYTARVEYWGNTPVGVHALLWENGTIATVPQVQFNEELVANQCVSYFTAEWLKWNPAPNS
jgi:hypothetical protein